MCASGDNVLRAIIRSVRQQTERQDKVRSSGESTLDEHKGVPYSRVEVNWESFLEMFGPFAMRSLVAVAGAYFRGAGSELSPFERYLFPLHRHLEILKSASAEYA